MFFTKGHKWTKFNKLELLRCESKGETNTGTGLLFSVTPPVAWRLKPQPVWSEESQRAWWAGELRGGCSSSAVQQTQDTSPKMFNPNSLSFKTWWYHKASLWNREHRGNTCSSYISYSCHHTTRREQHSSSG